MASHRPRLDYAEIVVPLDGSAFADRAVTTARWLGEHLHAPVRLLRVIDDHPVDAIAADIGFGDRTLGCMATHGRDRSAALVGSVARGVVGAVQAPVVLVGPAAVDRPPAGAPVVVAVEGTPDDEDLARTGAAWAVTLGSRLVLVTVAEPAPEPVRPGAAHLRARGPDAPGAYLGTLVAHLSSPPVAVRTEIVEDPISVHAGLIPWLQSIAPALVVVGARPDHRLRRLVLGDHCSEIVHDAPCPSLVVPVWRS